MTPKKPVRDPTLAFAGEVQRHLSRYHMEIDVVAETFWESERTTADRDKLLTSLARLKADFTAAVDAAYDEANRKLEQTAQEKRG